MNNLRWSASVMCAPLGRLEEVFQTLEAAGCHELHFDIMDGAFVPNTTLGADFVKMAKACCGLPCDVHLMVSKPERHIARFVEAGSDSISVHVEATPHGHRTLTGLREAGVSPGIAINPATPLTKLEYLLPRADRVMVMTVDPGFAGQKMISGALERVQILKENLEYAESKTAIQVDGNIDSKNAALLARAGAEIFVLGTSSVFNGDGLRERFTHFERAVQEEIELL